MWPCVLPSFFTVECLGDVYIFNINFHACINESFKRLSNMIKAVVNSLVTKSRDCRIIQTWIQILVLLPTTYMKWMAYCFKMDQGPGSFCLSHLPPWTFSCWAASPVLVESSQPALWAVRGAEILDGSEYWVWCSGRKWILPLCYNVVILDTYCPL